MGAFFFIDVIHLAYILMPNLAGKSQFAAKAFNSLLISDFRF